MGVIGIVLDPDFGGGPEARAEVMVGDDPVALSVLGDQEGGYEGLIETSLRTLAYCCLFGEVAFNIDYLEGEERGKAEEAIAKLSEDDITITLEDAVLARRKASADGNRIGEVFAHLTEFVEAQRRDGDEGLTLGEAATRHEDGTERLRGMVDPEAS